MSHPDILIISYEADAYTALLRAALPKGVSITACRKPEEVRLQSGAQTIVLGEPHLVAAAAQYLPALRWVQSTWAGIRPLLPLAASGVEVTGVKEVFGPQMAEYVLGYLLARELKLFERLQQQQAGQWWTTDNERLAGRTLGIMGTGSIGACIARAAAPFGVRLLGYSRSGRDTPPFERVYGPAQFREFLAGLDYLVSVLPDTPASTGLLSREALAWLPPRAVLINVGRGSVLDEAALADALEAGALAGAVLDVFHEEPLPPGHRFWRTPKLLITAHIAARSYPRDISAIFVDNYQRFVRGAPLLHRIEAERGY